MAPKRPTTFSMRMPEDLNEKINSYAAEHKCTKAEAMTRFARAGIELEENGQLEAPTASAAPSAGASQETLSKIEERLEALQNLPTIEAQESKAIVPVDIHEKIHAYSEEHECSEEEALAYYARLGIQLSGETRAATTQDVDELRGRLDALAQDSQQKGEQLAHMADLLASIREYTKPDEFVLEGEVAEDAEDVESDEPTEEELQRMADERTRQIVSDVMEEYASKQRAEREEMQRWAESNEPDTRSIMMIAVSVAVVVLAVAIIVLLVTRG